MNNYKSFSELKEELGNNYDFKLYEMGISALKEIENLQQENKQLKENYERIYNENCKLREEHNITDINLLDENYKLKDNWNIIKQEILKIRQSTFSKYNSNEWENCLSFNDDIKPILDKMQEIEQESGE